MSTDPTAQGIAINARAYGLTRKNFIERRSRILTTDAPTMTWSATPPTGQQGVLPVMPMVRTNTAGVWVNSTSAISNPAGAAAFSSQDLICTGLSYTFGWISNLSAGETYMIWIDGQPVSLTPQTPGISTTAGTAYWGTLTFGSAVRRRIEIGMTNTQGWRFGFTTITGVCQAAPPRQKIHLVGDSFLGYTGGTTSDATPGGVLYQDFDASITVDSGPGTGYVKTNGSYLAFGDASRVALATAIQPDVIVFMGSVNDDGGAAGPLQTGIQAAAQTCYSAYGAACPKARIAVLGPQPTNNTDTISSNRQSNVLSVSAACVATNIPFYDIVGNTAGTFTAFTGQTYNPGALVTSLGSFWSFVPNVAQNCSATNNQPGQKAGFWANLSAGLYGTGKVGSTTGDGNRDVCLYSDGVHPMPPMCGIYSELFDKIINEHS